MRHVELRLEWWLSRNCGRVHGHDHDHDHEQKRG
jgi:hypothetical protein